MLNEWVFVAVMVFAVGDLGVQSAFSFLPRHVLIFRYSEFAQWVLFAAVCVAPFIAASHFLVFVPKYTLVQAQNFFTGSLHAYTPGLHLKAPWYVRHSESDYIDTRLIVIEGQTTFVTKDGVPITYQWTTQSRIHAPLLGLNTRVSLEDLAKTVADVIENVFQNEFLDEEVQVLRQRETVKRIEERLISVLNAPMPEWREEDESVTLDYEKNPVWIRFGIVFELTTLGAPSFTDDYKQAMTAKAIANMINETAKKFREDTEASPDVALNTALIINKENVKRDIITFEGLDSTIGKAVTTVMRVFKRRD